MLPVACFCCRSRVLRIPRLLSLFLFPDPDINIFISFHIVDLPVFLLVALGKVPHLEQGVMNECRLLGMTISGESLTVFISKSKVICSTRSRKIDNATNTTIRDDGSKGWIKLGRGFPSMIKHFIPQNRVAPENIRTITVYEEICCLKEE